MATKTEELAKECKRQFENCLYTATSLLIWVRWLRIIKVVFVVAPIICGSLGSWKILMSSPDESTKLVGAIASLLGGLFSTIYSALKLDTHIKESRIAAGELTNLRDSFRQAALVSSKKPFEVFETEVAKLRSRLDRVRNQGHTSPEVCFWLAQRKVKAGDYSFDLDTNVEAQRGEAVSAVDSDKQKK